MPQSRYDFDFSQKKPDVAYGRYLLQIFSFSVARKRKCQWIFGVLLPMLGPRHFAFEVQLKESYVLGIVLEPVSVFLVSPF